MKNNDERYYWLGFSVFPGIGPKRFQLLLNHFGSAKTAWEASKEELIKVIGKALLEKFDTHRSKFDFKEYLKKIKDSEADFFILNDEKYPRLLKEIENPPFVLFVKGNVEILNQDFPKKTLKLVQGDTFEVQDDNKYIAVVGTRKITSYGREVTAKITEMLVSAGYTIVSGLAFGVDAAAHQATIENNGKTIAVLGCGVDICSPRENINLYNRILETGGAIVSEYPLETEPTKGSFPSRNRIIAGLSEAVIVTEGAEDSGSLYTANDALKIGRSVFAVPGPITSQLSKGPHSLINKGAKLVTSTEQLLKDLDEKSIPLREASRGIKSIRGIKSKNREEQVIINLLQNEGLCFDEIVRRTKMDAVKIGSLLSIMELKRMVKSDGGLFLLSY